MAKSTIMVSECSVVILAAGNSERMGFPKFLLEYSNNLTFIEHFVNQYNIFGCKQIVCVLNPSGYKVIVEQLNHIGEKVTFAINPNPERGRFSSIKIGLSKITGDNPVIIQNIDNPYISMPLLSELLEKCSEYNYTNPVVEGKGGHPVVIDSKIKNDIIREESNDLRLDFYLKNYNGYKLNVDDKRILFNINNMDDYQKSIINQMFK